MHEHDTGEIGAHATNAARLRVLLWSPKGAGRHYGGPGMTAYRMYSRARPGRFEISLVHGYPGHERLSLYSEMHELSRISRRPIDQVRFLRAGVRWVRENAARYDVFHGLQGFHLTVRPALEAKRLGLPAVIKLAAHKSDLSDKPGTLSGLLGTPRRRRRWVMELDAIIAISRAIEEEMLGYGFPESKVVRIPNGVDTEQFRPVADEAERREARLALGWPDRPTLLFIGGINRRKRPHLLVHALADAVHRGHDAQLALAGPEDEPEYMSRLMQTAEDLGVRNRLIYAGFTQDVAALYRASDVFALLSSKEGMANSVLEAMASGLPSIVSNISGTTDLIEDDVHGRVIDVPGDAPVPEAGEILAAYLDNYETTATHARAARQRAEAHFSATAIADRHHELFTRIRRGA